MTQIADFNDGGSRQCAEYITVVIDATEFSGVSATASTLDAFSVPPGSVIIDVSGNVETLFNGGTTDKLDIGIGADVDALGVGGADNLAAAGALAVTQGVQFGEKLTSATTINVTYTPGAAASVVGSVRVNIGYIIDGRSESVYD